VDRVILVHAHSAMDYLGAACRARGARGTVHVYGIREAAEEGEARDRIQSAARTAGFRMKGLSQHHVRAYSPTKYQTAFDVTVVRGWRPSRPDRSRLAAPMLPTRATAAFGRRLAR